MAGEMQRLEEDLSRALQALKGFKEFKGALDFPALSVLFWGASGVHINVAIRDDTGCFYRGRVTALRENSETFTVLADDGELVNGLTTASIIAVRMSSPL